MSPFQDHLHLHVVSSPFILWVPSLRPPLSPSRLRQAYASSLFLKELLHERCFQGTSVGKEHDRVCGRLGLPFPSPTDTFLQGLSCAGTRKPLSDAKPGNGVSEGKKKKKKSHCGLLHGCLWEQPRRHGNHACMMVLKSVLLRSACCPQGCACGTPAHSEGRGDLEGGKVGSIVKKGD